MVQKLKGVPQTVDRAYSEFMAGRLVEAEMLCRQVLGKHPNHADALHLLGLVAMRLERIDAALELIGKAIQFNPTIASFHANYGLALARQGRWDEAIAVYFKALELRPDAPETLHNLGIAYKTKGEFQKAEEYYRQALAIKPRFPECLADLANTLHEIGEYDRSIEANLQAMAMLPDMPRAHWNLGITQLLKGELKQGWQNYEWRWKVRELPLPPNAFKRPNWQGESLRGKHLVLYQEQGWGDVIQMIRFVPRLIEMGAEISIACEQLLHRALAGIGPVKHWIANLGRLPEFDVRCPLMSLPHRLGTTLETIPAKIPYLRADSAMSEQWRNRIAEKSSGLKVGLVWAGRPEHLSDRRRSIALAMLAALAAAGNVSFFSLQKGAPSAQARDGLAGVPITDWTEELNDFADTAALMDNLDLIISVDTAPAHLAGALGKPIWVLMPYVPDWRWMLKRSDSPWYPTMRLFRQERMDQWQEPIARAAEELQKLASEAEQR
ncbi:MAG: tetratricopeptide repeat protein [Tepidisphaeraceae bacterium]